MEEKYDLTLYNYLKKHLNVCYLTSVHDETNIRCPFCGDSLKDPRDAHLYINNLSPFKYYCQKCNISGIVDDNLLKELKLYEPKIISYVKETKKEYLRQINIKYGNSYFSYFNNEIEVLPNDFGKLEVKKLNYINKRLGIEINTEDELKQFRIILNIEDFFNENEIEMNKYFKENYKDLNKNYVGFLLNDKNMICFRNINKNPKYRYVNKKIYNDSVFQSRKFYSIENNLNIERTVYNIYLSEGIFDILGIYHNIHNCKMNDNDIFISCNGKSYPFVLNYLKSLAILNCNINIYSDNDVKLDVFKKMSIYNDLIKFNGANIYYNTIGKDYGVPKDKIILSKPFVL